MEVPAEYGYSNRKIAVTAPLPLVPFFSTAGCDGSPAGGLCGLYLGPTLSLEFCDIDDWLTL